MRLVRYFRWELPWWALMVAAKRVGKGIEMGWLHVGSWRNGDGVTLVVWCAKVRKYEWLQFFISLET